MAQATVDLSNFNWDTLPEATIRDLHKEAELCLSGTISLAADQDQRSTTLCGIFGALAVALLAALATLIAAKSAYIPAVLAELTTSGGLIVASCFCALAAQPSSFHVAGYEPRRLIVSAQAANWMLGYAIDDLQRRIDENRAVLERAARWTQRGIWCAAIALLLGVISFIASAWCLDQRPF